MQGFTHKAILEQLPTIVKTANGCLSSWAGASGAVPLLGEMKHLTCDIACFLVLGDVKVRIRTFALLGMFTTGTRTPVT